MTKSNKLVICQGLPACGKSTWCRQQVLDAPGQVKVLNRDSLRLMCDAGIYSKGNERHIREIEIRLAEYYLREGCTVIIDDTNLIESTLRSWREVAERMHVPYRLQDFRDVPVEMCIERDRHRSPSVGEAVILRMARQAGLIPVVPPPAYNPALPDAIICDMDGTLAKLNGRNPYDAARCEEDLLNTAVADVLAKYTAHRTVILLVSGRKATHRPQTERWLAKHDVQYLHLYMREAEDDRKDAIVKRAIYDAHIAGRYNVLFVLDDRNQCIRLWRDDLGLQTWQVAEGDF